MATRSLSKAAHRRVDVDGAKVLRQMRAAPALFTQEEMYKLEASIAEDRDGMPRRVALALLARPGGDFLDSIAADREAAVALAEVSKSLGGYVKRLRELTKLMEAAQGRMVIALANREDMDSVLKEARS
jgi:hypothetical protein